MAAIMKIEIDSHVDELAPDQVMERLLSLKAQFPDSTLLDENLEAVRELVA